MSDRLMSVRLTDSSPTMSVHLMTKTPNVGWGLGRGKHVRRVRKEETCFLGLVGSGKVRLGLVSNIVNVVNQK